MEVTAPLLQLKHEFNMSGKVITPTNDNLPLFSISEVPDSSIIKLLGKFKNSKAKDVFSCDCIPEEV